MMHQYKTDQKKENLSSDNNYNNCFNEAKQILESVIAIDAGSKTPSYGAGDEHK